MGSIVAGMATSHAFALVAPEEWDGIRTRNRETYIQRRGDVPPELPGVARETLEANKARYQRVRDAHDRLRRQVRDSRANVFIAIGDDQDENFSPQNIPQFAVYVGGDFRTGNRFGTTARRYKAHTALARDILRTGVARGFDLASLGAFPDDLLISHAHLQVLDAFVGDAPIEVVLIFINAIHFPATEPARCYALGRLIADVVRDRPAGERVAVCGSGGLSHFTAGYPWSDYKGPYTYGAISEAFDRDFLDHLESGDVDRINALTSQDLIDHGNIELRCWIAALGAVGRVPAGFTVYEPFYRGVMGMGVASWPGQPG